MLNPFDYINNTKNTTWKDPAVRIASLVIWICKPWLVYFNLSETSVCAKNQFEQEPKWHQLNKGYLSTWASLFVRYTYRQLIVENLKLPWKA